MVRPDRAVGVRGRVLHREGAGGSDKTLADPLERGRHGGRRHADSGLDRRVGTAGRGVGETAERPLTPVAPRAFGLRRDRREARRHVVLRRRDDHRAVLFLRGRRTAKRERKRQRENEDDDCRGLTHPSHLTGSPLETPGGSVRSRVLLVSVRCPGRGAEPLYRYPVAAGGGTAALMARAQHAAAESHRLIRRTLACLRAGAVACAPRGSVVTALAGARVHVRRSDASEAREFALVTRSGLAERVADDRCRATMRWGALLTASLAPAAGERGAVRFLPRKSEVGRSLRR